MLTFRSGANLRSWLIENHDTSAGIWIRIFKENTGVASVSFAEVLDEGLCFGWSESSRRKGDDNSYLQRFTPRRKVGTGSKRNREHVERLIREGKMTPAGAKALGLG